MTPLHFKKFNDKIQVMNQSNAKELKMTAAEARSLHVAIFAMLEELNSKNSTDPVDEILEVSMDAGDNSL